MNQYGIVYTSTNEATGESYRWQEVTIWADSLDEARTKALEVLIVNNPGKTITLSEVHGESGELLHG